MLSRYPKPVDRSLWDMLPQTNNAYYNPSTNQITFPAAILQPPYFDPNADPAANYGSIGATIGHEIGHGFDDQGRKFDGIGRLRDWWTKSTAAKYEHTPRHWLSSSTSSSRLLVCISKDSRRSARISAISVGSKWLMPPIADMWRSMASRR